MPACSSGLETSDHEGGGTDHVVIGIAVSATLQIFTLFEYDVSHSSRSHFRRLTSMRFSIRFLIFDGSGWKRLASCRVTSLMRVLCVMCLRSFMIRTIHAYHRTMRHY